MRSKAGGPQKAISRILMRQHEHLTKGCGRETGEEGLMGGGGGGDMTQNDLCILVMKNMRNTYPQKEFRNIPELLAQKTTSPQAHIFLACALP